MKERPILFSAPMVRALLAGTKTQTRRPVKERSPWPGGPAWVMSILPGERLWPHEYVGDARTNLRPMLCPYGAPGDRLWVKETIRLLPEFEPESEHAVSEFSADGEITKADAWPWKRRVLPSIHMPRGLSRIALEITEVRVQRLQNISEEDAIAEGVEATSPPDMLRYRDYRPEKEGLRSTWSYARDSFHSLWESINGTASFAANPWIWALTFTRVTP